MDESSLPNEPGVYMLMNITTRERYIGCSVNIAHRIHVHFRELRKGRHINKLLQAAYQRYGEAVFEVRVLEVCPDIRTMPEREHWHIIRRQPEYNGTSTERAIEATRELDRARLAAYRARSSLPLPTNPLSDVEIALRDELRAEDERRRRERMNNRIID